VVDQALLVEMKLTSLVVVDPSLLVGMNLASWVVVDLASLGASW